MNMLATNLLTFALILQNAFGNAAKKPKFPVASVFGNDSDDE